MIIDAKSGKDSRIEIFHESHAEYSQAFSLSSDHPTNDY